MEALSRLHFDVVRWAEERDIFANATPEQQMAVTWEEIRESAEALEIYRYAQQVSMDYDPEVSKKAATTELGDILVTLCIAAHMQKKTLPQCMAAAPITGPVQTWQFIGEWARKLQYTLDGREEGSPIPLIGAVANCASEAARIQLARMSEECLALALQKIQKRQGAMNPQTGKWEKVSATPS